MARGAGQGRAITGPRLFGCSFDAFLLTHIPKRRRNKTKSKTSPRLGSPIGSSIRHMYLDKTKNCVSITNKTKGDDFPP